MKQKLHFIFIQNWQRKLISFILAIIIWLLVNNSLITEKTYTNIPIRITNVPKGMHVQGIQPDGFLSQRITLKIVGHKKILEDLSQEDLQIMLNAQDKSKEWIAMINKHQIVFLNKLNNPYPMIRSVTHEPFVICMQEDTPHNP